MSLKHSGPTDSVHEVRLSSTLQRVSWGRGGASAGSTVSMIVATQFVGDGAPVELVIRSQDNTEHLRTRSEVRSGRCVARIVVPDDAGDWICFVARLSEYGLEEASGWLRVTPRREVVRAAWDREIVERGDTVTLTVDTKGIPDGEPVEITILRYDRDGAHRALVAFDAPAQRDRVDTKWTFDFRGDTADIVANGEAEGGYRWPEFFFRAAYEDSVVESSRAAFQDWIQLSFADADGTPYAHTRYEIDLPDGSTRGGTLDEKGEFLLTGVPPGPYQVRFPEVKESVRQPLSIRSRVAE